MPLRLLAFAASVALLGAFAWASEPDLTFLAWSDQHVTRDGDWAHLRPAIEAMNGID